MPDASKHSTAIAIAATSSFHSGCYPPNFSITIATREFNTTAVTDSLGYLGIGKAEPEQRPLLVFGDSFAYGFGVQSSESFAARLGAYNAGLWGMPPPQHAMAFAKCVPVVKPSRALWIIYPSHLLTLRPNPWKARRSFDPNAHPITAWMFDQFNKTKISLLILCATGWGYNRPDSYSLEWSLYDPDDDLSLSVYPEFERAVASVVQTAKTQGVQVIPVFVPSKMRLGLALEHARPLLMHTKAKLDPDLTVDRMSDIFSRNGIPKESQIDLMELFVKKEFPWREAYFQIDAHFNSRGSGEVAKFLSEKLKAIPPTRTNP